MRSGRRSNERRRRSRGFDRQRHPDPGRFLTRRTGWGQILACLLLGHADVTTTLFYTLVLNRPGSRGVLSPDDRLPGAAPPAPSETGYAAEPVRTHPGDERVAPPEPSPSEPAAVESSNQGLRGFWTKLVRFLGAGGSMSEWLDEAEHTLWRRK